MIDGQLNIFDMIYPKFKIDKPIRLIELFGGYGSQALALKYLGVKFEHWKLCEWAVKSIQAYKDIHFTDDNLNYCKIADATKEQLIECLYNYGISINYNEPMTKQQISRLSEKQLETIYNNIFATNNLVNIQQVKGQDLEINDTDRYCYIMTYSFPCQDLSLAGKGKGMSDTSTRSGMLWEVERILSECYDLKTMPQVLLMENVPQVHSVDNLEDFNKWKDRLEELGYKNYFQDLIATDYGIPQTRNRCFMVSILGEYNYTFPKPIPLKLKLKDLLEDNVSEKYYLSDKMMKYLVSTDNDKYKVNENNLVINREIACSKTTREGCSRADTTDYICNDLPNNFNLYKSSICIKNNNSKGYLEATEGDGINISSRMDYQRGNVQKEKALTITTSGGNNVGVCVKEIIPFGTYYTWKDNQGNINTQCNRAADENKSALTIACANTGNVLTKENQNNLRIRKLTPKECFRLMGVKDQDYENCAKNQSDSSLYHLAGDSIVVNVLMAIFKEML